MKSILLLVILIIISIGVVIGSIYAYNTYIYPMMISKPTTNNTVATTTNITTIETIKTKDGQVNLSSIEGNVTNIKPLADGTFLLTVSSSKEAKYKDNVIQSIKKEAGQFSNVCSVQITTKDNNESRVVYEKHNSVLCGFVAPPPVVQPPVPCKDSEHLFDGKCIPNPPPIPICNNNQVYNITSNKCEPIVIEPSKCPTGQAYNETSQQCEIVVIPPPPKPTCTVDQIYNETTNKCDAKPVIIPPTPPAPNATTIKVILTGDIGTNTDSTAVFNAIKKQNADNVVILGDLGYASNLNWFKSTYGTLGNKLNCVVGNHEAANEDGTSAIEKEAKQYCADSYYFKKNHVLFLGFNTNGDLNIQATEAGKLLTNTAFMDGIKSVHIMSHKPCAVPPNSHHPLEIKGFCDAVKSKIPSGVKAYYDQAHNHVMSASADGTYKQVGSGGKSHYTCGTSAAFPYCDNVHFGYLEYTIQPDGTTTSQFVDSKGSIVK